MSLGNRPSRGFGGTVALSAGTHHGPWRHLVRAESRLPPSCPASVLRGPMRVHPNTHNDEKPQTSEKRRIGTQQARAGESMGHGAPDVKVDGRVAAVRLNEPSEGCSVRDKAKVLQFAKGPVAPHTALPSHRTAGGRSSNVQETDLRLATMFTSDTPRAPAPAAWASHIVGQTLPPAPSGRIREHTGAAVVSQSRHVDAPTAFGEFGRLQRMTLRGREW